MLYLILHPDKRPAEKQVDLLRATLSLAGIEFTECGVDVVPDGGTIITDCFLMETPYGDPGHTLTTRILDHAVRRNNNIIFYYPSESYSSFSSSFCATADYVSGLNIKTYLIKNGDWDIPGYTKNYNLLEFFAWIINNEFNQARLARTVHAIDSHDKTHKFLYLNGEQRTNREHLFTLVEQAGLLDSSIWSHRKSKSATGFGPGSDWQDPFVHPDFRFYAYYPDHYINTSVSIVAETTQSEFFPTEKTYKSLMLGHPFILFGGCGDLEKIQQLGFKTYSPWIDESYDQAEYPLERAEHVVQAMLSCPGTINHLAQEVNLHNRRQFGLVANQAYFRLLNILQDIDKTITINESFTVTQDTLTKYFLK